MSAESCSSHPRQGSGGRALLGVAALLFALSGAGTLVLETLWMRWFRLLLGATAPAVSTTLIAFFLGQALGAAWSGRRAASWRHPLRSYGTLELAAVLAFGCVPALLGVGQQLLDAGYDGLREQPVLLLGARLGVALLATLPAAALSGATLPALVAACIGSPGALGSRGGLLYGVNTLGAAAGTAAATFWLPEALGVHVGYHVGLALLASAGCGAWLASLRWKPKERPETPVAGRPRPPRERAATHLSPGLLASFAAFSGLGSFAAEILLVQAFGRVLNQSSFAYGTVLIAVLLSLGGGALLVAGLVRRGRTSPERVLEASLVLAALGLAAFPALFVQRTAGLASVPVGAAWLGGWSATPLLVLWTAGPALLGLAGVFPAVLALGGTGRGVRHAARPAGRLLAWNTAGALCGALLAPYVLLPWAGLWPATGMISLVYAILALRVPGRSRWGNGWRAAFLGLALVGVLALGGAPTRLPRLHLAPGERLVHAESSAAGLVAVVARAGGRVLQVDNHYALGGDADAVHQRREGYLPLLLHANPRRVAFLGSATGSSASAALRFPVERIVLVELVPGVAKQAQRYFSADNGDIYADPRTEVVLDDARNYLRATHERFDVVVADLFVPWRAGTAALYSREHFAAARAHLRPGGIFCQWLPLYQLSAQELRMVAATFRDVFPDGSLWRGDFFGSHPIVALIGSAGAKPSALATRRAVERLAQRGVRDRWVTQPQGPLALALAPLAAGAEAFADTPRNSDDHPRLEFLAARSHAGGRQTARVGFTGIPWVRFAKQLLDRAEARGQSPWRAAGSEAWRAAEGGHALQAASALFAAGRTQQAAQALSAAAARLDRALLDPEDPDPTAAEVWPAAGVRSAAPLRPGESHPGHASTHPWIRLSCPPHSFSRRRNFWILPVEVLGRVANSTAFGHLKWARCSRQKSMRSAPEASAPGFNATKAFGTSPHFGCGIPTTAHSRTAGCFTRVCSTSMVEMFSPPLMMMSFLRSRSSM